MTVTNSYQRTNSTYALLYAFEPDWGWLQQRENKLDTYLQQGLTNSIAAGGERNLEHHGVELDAADRKAGTDAGGTVGMLPQYFHRLGRMAQETGRGYYVDVYMQFTGEYPKRRR